LEINGEETSKEVQNILLRHNSEMKSWYIEYTRNIEATNSKESFAMTFKQVWRLIRDTLIISETSKIVNLIECLIMVSRITFLFLDRHLVECLLLKKSDLDGNLGDGTLFYD
jgi:hypothetical protein